MDWSSRIGRRIKLRDLHILATTVKYGSLAKAADRLAVSRPVVSKAIADLEHVIGVRLLERDRHGAEPTIYGRALLARGAVAFDALREGVKDIEFLSDPGAGEVRVGCHQFLATGFVSAVIDRLSRSRPRIVVHVVASETEAMYRDLAERSVDLLIAWRLGPFSDDTLAFEPLFKDRCVVAAGRRHSLAGRRRLTQSDIAGARWALPPADSILGALEAKAFRAIGLDYPRASVASISPHVLTSQLATGRFITVVPESVLRLPARNPQVKTLAVDLPGTELPIGVVTLKSKMLSPVAQLFIETARQVARARLA